MNKNKGKVFYIGNFAFPKGNAAGIRVLNNGYLLRKLGYDVSFIGHNNSKKISSNTDNSFENYDGFEFLSLIYPKSTKEWFFISHKLNIVKDVLDRSSPTFIVLYGSLSNAFFTYFLIKWCRKRKITVYTDCVDWLHISSNSVFFKVFKTFDTYLRTRYFNALSDGVITISSYLNNYYRSLGVATVTIPPLNCINKDSRCSKQDCNGKIKLFYAGNPFTLNVKNARPESFKDRLDLILDYLGELTEFDFLFNIYGLTKDEYLQTVSWHVNLVNRLESKVIFHGKVDNVIATSSLKESHYIVLLRHSNRMTNFGFPSKISESIGYGIPAITTRTSDLDKYISDGVSGHFIDIDDFNRGCNQLKLIFEKHAVNYSNILKASQAENSLHYSNFQGALEEFLSVK